MYTHPNYESKDIQDTVTKNKFLSSEPDIQGRGEGVYVEPVMKGPDRIEAVAHPNEHLSTPHKEPSEHNKKTDEKGSKKGILGNAA